MDKTVEKIIIGLESIDVISRINNVNSITQLNINDDRDSLKEIFEKYNLSEIINYNFDARIVKALGENEKQLRNYLEICKQVNSGYKNIEKSDNMPYIEYNLRNIKENQELTIPEKIDLYEQAKYTQNALRKAKERVIISVGITDRIYLSIQKLLSQNLKNYSIKLLNSGEEVHRNIREELYDPELTEKTNTISSQFIIKDNTQERQEVKER